MTKIISQTEFVSPEMKAKIFKCQFFKKICMFSKMNNQILSDKLCAAYIVKYKHRTRKKKNIFFN